VKLHLNNIKAHETDVEKKWESLNQHHMNVLENQRDETEEI
jgi:hypothetical protein